MSILLAGLDVDLAAAVTRRLLAQGDQVRVIAGEGAAPPGAHVAVGEPGDEDLVERAAQGARTIVLGPLADEERAAALAGAARAGVDRAVLLERGLEDVPPALSWIVLLMPGRRLLARRSRLDPEALAEAIDAADDLAGDPRLTVDLGAEEGWRALRLEPPGG